jgi:ubiquinone biosynthesis protein COQ4
MKKIFYCQLTLRERRGTPQPLQGRLLPLNVPMNQLLYSRSQTVFSLWKRFLGSLHTTESSKTRNYDSWIDTRALLYKGHVKTTPLQKLALAVGSALIAFYDPLRTDMVAILGETTGLLALRQMHEKMKRHPVGQLILTEKPRVNTSTVRMEHLNTLPEHTFGKAYYQFMKLHGFSPNERPQVRFVDDEELAYVMQRYREVHDFWHVISGLETNVLGEIALKWFEFLHTGLPMCGLSSIVGPLRLSLCDQWRLGHEYIPWAFECNRRCQFLMNVYYEKHFDEPLEDLRKKLGFIRPPHGGQ